MKPGLVVYAGALLILVYCAKRKPAPMVATDSLTILALTKDAAFANYELCRARLTTAKCPSIRARLESAARASLDVWFRWQESDPSLIDYVERTHGWFWDHSRKAMR